MQTNRHLLLLAAIACLTSVGTTRADVVLFSNNFEDGNFDPEVGSWDFGTSSVTSVVGTSDPALSLGSNVGLFDRTAAIDQTLDLSLVLADTGSLAGGNTVTIDFNYAARRTNGSSKTVFLDALDSSGNIVTRLVLGDTGAFGNGSGDRQRPGYDPGSTGSNETFDLTTGTGATGTAPGSFWSGSDTSPASFNVPAAAEVSLTIGADEFAFSTVRAFTGVTYSTTQVANFDDGTFSDIASIEVSSSGNNYGFYLDNLEVSATATVPEPSSFALLGIAAAGLSRVRRSKSKKK